jgi:hypothetical protein
MNDRTVEQFGTANPIDAEPFKVAILGGEPGGMFTGVALRRQGREELPDYGIRGGERLGGKIQTGQFAGIGPYEAGAIEIYDYSRLGPDPVHDLIVKDLDLQPQYLRGGPCVLGGKIILDPGDLAHAFGERTRDEAISFRERAAGLLKPESFYFSAAKEDNAHPWVGVSGSALLEREIKDDAARRYIRTMARSDVAAAPHQTNGLNFLKNVPMDVDGYLDVCSVVGGSEQIVAKLASPKSSMLKSASVRT